MIACKECGDIFLPSGKKNIFCSNKCRTRDYRKRIAILAKEIKGGKIISIKILKEDNKQIAKIVLDVYRS